MNGNVVALPAEFLERGRVPRLLADSPGAVHREVGIVAVNLHAKRDRRIRDFRADGAEADDTELLAANFRSDKLLLALLGFLRDIGRILMRRNPVHGRDYVSRGKQHLANHKFLHAVCVCAGRIKDHHALLGEALQGDVVDTRSRPRHGQSRRAEFLLVHVRGAHQDALCLLPCLRQRKVREQAL